MAPIRTDTQHPITIPIPEDKRTATGAVQWFLEKNEDSKVAPVRYRNELDVYICGEDAFRQIAGDIRSARASVEIICWGFDPAMELTRERQETWPRGVTWGELLRDVAAGKFNGGHPVQVRLLAWYGFIGSTMLGANNMPGYSHDRRSTSQTNRPLNPDDWTEGLVFMPQDKRKEFNARWYQDAFVGAIDHLAIRTRDNSRSAVQKSLADEAGKRGAVENLGLSGLPTDHQKTILIDYEHEGGSHAVGYVMGLNSVTDYWDTQKHLFNDPRRGQPWEGAGDGAPGLKPYQDYACRIRGGALVEVSRNFTSAWNRASGNGTAISRKHDAAAPPPPGLTSTLKGDLHSAQIVRTQAQEGEKTIARLYHQASSFARNYLYVENQYFQHTEWATQLKAHRASFAKYWKAAGRAQSDLPDLHVMVVIPTPERSQMVPRTYDSIKALGHGSSMPNQNKLVEDELKRHGEQQARWEAHVQSQAAKGEVPDPDYYPAPLSPIAASAKALGAEGGISKDLQSIGMRTLVASLWTFDHDWRSTQRKELGVLAELEATARSDASQAERIKSLREKLGRGRYREIYIHSKLMLIDDSFFTLGSANLNLRSMAVDTEINVASDSPEISKDLRKRVWAMLTEGTLDGYSGTRADIKHSFEKWEELAESNGIEKSKGKGPVGFLMPFEDVRTSRIRLA
ncbi:phospholipase D-like domain-containing protein [Variovorax sp. OV329]|uniref:phospholipase D-like domain-containing protein n=1 Tax=Variovorax sp. OV329 TaxID=1882825 RepID=UPI0008F1D25C|nr:phospholipase D-like domain-containing protein [Variovorax sp. OV329]SFL88113.1 PLD-like domain-containing protein [Variovorax sp. OV329]